MSAVDVSIRAVSSAASRLVAGNSKAALLPLVEVLRRALAAPRYRRLRCLSRAFKRFEVSVGMAEMLALAGFVPENLVSPNGPCLCAPSLALPRIRRILTVLEGLLEIEAVKTDDDAARGVDQVRLHFSIPFIFFQKLTLFFVFVNVL